MADEPLQQNRRMALTEIGRFTATLISVTLGALVLSATLLKTSKASHHMWWLYSGWIVLTLSIIAGIGALLEQIGRLAAAELADPMRGWLRWLNGAQLLGVLVGLGLLMTFARMNLH